MCRIVFSDGLQFGDASLPVHLASDCRVYVETDELCGFIGIHPEGQVRQTQADPCIQDLPERMGVRGGKHGPHEAVLLNLAALPYWLGTVCAEGMKRPDLHDKLVRYSLEFLDVTWMHYRAALFGAEPGASSRF